MTDVLGLVKMAIFIVLVAAPFVYYSQRKKYQDLAKALVRFQNTRGITIKIFDENFEEHLREDDYLEDIYPDISIDKAVINEAIGAGHNLLSRYYRQPTDSTWQRLLLSLKGNELATGILLFGYIFLVLGLLVIYIYK